MGVDKVVVGSLALENSELFLKLLEDFPNRITLALDVELNQNRQAFVASSAWTEISNIRASDLLKSFRNRGLKQILCTDIKKDGMLSGANLELYQELQTDFPEYDFIASGGISDMNDLRSLANIPLYGAIVGKAIYENRISSKELYNAF